MRNLLCLFCLFCLFSACRSQPPTALGPTDVYTVSGEVLKYDATKHMASIKHGPISDATGKVWMDAMTMEFPVKEPRDRVLLQPGVKIKAKLFQRLADYEYWIGEVQVTP